MTGTGRLTSTARGLVDDELSVHLLRDRYQVLARLRERHGGSDSFPVRMLGRPGLVVRGPEGVRAFYDDSLVTRSGAVPAHLRLLLFGPGAVHGLDGPAHLRRKHLLMGLVDAQAVEHLARLVAAGLDRAVATWRRRPSVGLFDQLVGVYGAAVLDWAGTGTRGRDAERVSQDLVTIVDGFGVGATPYRQALAARLRAQRWAVRVIRLAREGRLRPPHGSVTAVLAGVPRDELSDTVAATELLNVVRPTVAVAYFGAYAAQALAAHPEWRERLASGDSDALRAFEHEVRRWYPFTPLLAGRLRRPLEWQGRRLRAGSWIFLDVVGTDRDPRVWDRPDTFDPARFLGREPTAYDYVPHGGGDPARGHRCPGEPAARRLLEVTLQRLAAVDYTVSEAGREVPWDRVPSLPADRMRITLGADSVSRRG